MKIIALNGWPKSGKTEVAEIIVRRYGGVIVDDALPLRRAVPHLFHGVDPSDCYTQEGKAKVIEVGGKPYTVRQLLGFVGDVMEERFGEFYLPEQAYLAAQQMMPAAYYIFPSVRKTEGWYYRYRGGAVVEIQRPEAKDSGNAFDRWDHSARTHVISNTGSLTDLENSVAAFMHKTFKDAGYAQVQMAA